MAGDDSVLREGGGIPDAESVLWCGAPDVPTYVFRKTLLMVLGAAGFLAGVLGLAVTLAFAAKTDGLLDDGVDRIFALMGGLALSAGWLFLAARRSRKTAGNARYFVTRDAIVCVEGGRVERLDLAQIDSVDWSEKPGEGAIPKGDLRAVLTPSPDSDGKTRTIMVGVEWPEEVCAILKGAWMARLRQKKAGIFDPEYTDQVGNTHLMHAVAKGDLATTRILVEAGAPIDRANIGGLTPLMSAAVAGRRDIAEYLLGRGADTSIVDQRNMSARDHAIDRGHPQIADLLAAVATGSA